MVAIIWLGAWLYKRFIRPRHTRRIDLTTQQAAETRRGGQLSGQALTDAVHVSCCLRLNDDTVHHPLWIPVDGG